MFSSSFLKRCNIATNQIPPRGLITTNIVGGLGNQLFLIANLLATANRNNLIPYLPISQINESSSCFDARPTYWNTPMMRGRCGVEEGSGLLSGAIYESAEEGTLRYFIEQNQNQQDHAIQQFLKYQSNNNNDKIQLIPELGKDAKKIVISSNDGNFEIPHYQLGGFFQSHRYFSDFSSTIAQLLFPQEFVEASKKSLEAGLQNVNPQQQQQQHVVALHVRRGDYLKLKETFEILDAESYYFEAIEKLFGTMLFSRKFGFSESKPSSSSTPQDDFFFGHQSGCFKPLFRVLIFTDQTDGESLNFAKLLRGSLEVKYPTIQASIVKNNHGSEISSPPSSLFVNFPEFDVVGDYGNNDRKNNNIPNEIKEMLIMSQCDDLIIANSSFSWWAAFFAKHCQDNESGLRRIVAPQKWFVGKPFCEQVHIYGSDWIIV